MRWQGFRLLAVLGLLPLVFGVGSLVDGDLLIGASSLLLGIVIGVLPLIFFRRDVRAYRGRYTAPEPDPAVVADPDMRRASRLYGRALQAVGIAPLLAAVGLIAVGWYVPHQDDDGTAGARAGFLMLMVLLAVVPATLAFGYYRSGTLIAAGDLDGVDSALVYNRIVWVLCGLLTAGALADDRPGPWEVVAAVTGVLTVTALALNAGLKALDRRVQQAHAAGRQSPMRTGLPGDPGR